MSLLSGTCNLAPGTATLAHEIYIVAGPSTNLRIGKEKDVRFLLVKRYNIGANVTLYHYPKALEIRAVRMATRS